MVDVVYKYMPLREEFFENRWLRFTQRSDLNDPFEVKPSLKQHAEYMHRVKGYGASVDEAISYVVANQYLVHRGLLIQDFDMYGILSLSGRCENLLMWSHYADSHRGMVIGLDANHEFFDKNFSRKERIKNCRHDFVGCLKEVKYSANRYVKSGDISDCFYLKSNDWWTEREFRFILPIAEADHINRDNSIMAFYEIPSDAILSVTFGLKACEDAEKRVIEKISEGEELEHIDIYKARMDTDSFDLIIDKYGDFNNLREDFFNRFFGK